MEESMVHLHRTQSEHWMEIIPCPKWMRVVLDGAVIADSKAVILLRDAVHSDAEVLARN